MASFKYQHGDSEVEFKNIPESWIRGMNVGNSNRMVMVLPVFDDPEDHIPSRTAILTSKVPEWEPSEEGTRSFKLNLEESFAKIFDNSFKGGVSKLPLQNEWFLERHYHPEKVAPDKHPGMGSFMQDYMQEMQKPDYTDRDEYVFLLKNDDPGILKPVKLSDSAVPVYLSEYELESKDQFKDFGGDMNAWASEEDLGTKYSVLHIPRWDCPDGEIMACLPGTVDPYMGMIWIPAQSHGKEVSVPAIRTDGATATPFENVSGSELYMNYVAAGAVKAFRKAYPDKELKTLDQAGKKFEQPEFKSAREDSQLQQNAAREPEKAPQPVQKTPEDVGIRLPSKMFKGPYPSKFEHGSDYYLMNVPREKGSWGRMIIPEGIVKPHPASHQMSVKLNAEKQYKVRFPDGYKKTRTESMSGLEITHQIEAYTRRLDARKVKAADLSASVSEKTENVLGSAYGDDLYDPI